MTTIYLVRHAEAEGNLYRRIHGWYNALITDNGFAQIAALERRFADIHVDAVYSSDLYRTMTTARAVHRPKGLELHTDPNLREIHMGDWEDFPWGAARHYQKEELLRFNRSDPTWRAPNGETLPEVGERMARALRAIAAKHPGQTVAVFSHGTAIRQALAELLQLPAERWNTLGHSDNTAVSCLRLDGERCEMEYMGDNSHLDESISTLARQAWWRGDKSKVDINLWYRPLDWATEQQLYLDCREEAWLSTHKDGPDFLPQPFLEDARCHLEQSPWGVTVAMAGHEIAGIIQVDARRYAEDGAGYIPFCYVMPAHRGQSLGIQLIGQAVSYFRPLGRDKLRLRCAPYNDRAQHFYRKYGFVKVGQEENSRVPLDSLEKYIGYDR